MHDEIARDDLPLDAEPAERRALAALAARLSAERPLPDLQFRGALGRHLQREQSRRTGVFPPPRRAITLAAWYSVAGIALLGLAAGGLAGAGPFAS